MEWRSEPRLEGHYGPECFESMAVMSCERGPGPDGPTRPFYVHLRLNFARKQGKCLETQFLVSHVDGNWATACVGVKTEPDGPFDCPRGLGLLWWLAEAYADHRVESLLAHAKRQLILTPDEEKEAARGPKHP